MNRLSPRLVHEFVRRQSGSFSEEGPGVAVGDFDFPLPVLSREGRQVLGTPQEFIAGMEGLNARFREAGCDSLSMRLVAQELPRRLRFRLWLRCDYSTLDGEVIATATLVFYCRDRGHRLCVEMVEVAANSGLPLTGEAPASGLRGAPARRRASAAR